MKQIKFLMVALTILMGVSFTSCINSESDPYSYGGGLVKVRDMYGSYYFESTNGVRVIPSAASITALEANGFKLSNLNGKVAQIYYRWDATKLEIPQDAKEIKGVELYSIESLDNTVAIVEEKGAPNDSTKNNKAPIISIGYSSNSDSKASFYDETTLFLPINYHINQKRHFLTLVYYPNEATTEGLTLYLRHNPNGDTESGNTTSYTLTANGYGQYGLGLFYKAYDLTEVFYHYRSVTGASEFPTTVNVVVQENPYSNNLDDPQTTEKKYTVTYKATEK